MRVTDGHKDNFEALKRALLNGDVCLLACKDVATGQRVVAICALSSVGKDRSVIVPLAKLFEGDPYEELIPPEVDDARSEQDMG